MKVAPRALGFLVIGVAVGLALALAPGCGSEDESPARPGPEKPDTIAPSAVTDLRLLVPACQTLALAWTSPGDDGTKGKAFAYDIRISKSLITEQSWSQADRLDSSCVPPPKTGGQIETIVIEGLESGTRYYSALKTTDEAGNESGLSNCATKQTLNETTPPSDVTDLVAVAVNSSAFELTWTAPGDDYMTGTASRYEIRYFGNPIIDETSWGTAHPVDAPPLPRPGGEAETLTVTVLTPNTNYFFALKAVDELNNWSGISNPAPGLAIDELFWVWPILVHKGERTFIAFRASPSELTRVTLHDYYYTLYCGDRVVEYLVNESYAGGVYSVTCDFYDKAKREYRPFGSYTISLCWGADWIKGTYVLFRE